MRRVMGVGLLLCSCFAAPAAGLAAPRQASQLPVGYWKLDEAAGPTAVASNGALNGTWHGTITTVTTPLPPLSYNTANSRAISLAGAQPDDYIEIANGPALENLQENSYTLSAWIRPASVPPGTAAAWNAAYGIVVKQGWHEGLVYGNGQHVQFDHWATGNPNPAWAGTGSWATGFTVAPNSAWTHVAAVWDRDADQVRVYVGGQLRGSAPAPADNRDYAANPWRIGIAYPGNGGDHAWPFDGMIDDVRMYNYALNLEQVGILNAGVPAPTNVSAAEGEQQVALTWTAPAPAGYGYTYTIYRSEDGGPFAFLVGNVSGTSYVDTTAITTTGSGPSYTYQIVAVSVAESGPATSNSAIPRLPTPRTKDHEEGFLDGDCACGATAGRPLAALALLAALTLLGLRRVQ